MKENNTKYFSTGEFAKLCKVHKKTLFHYDEIGLFKPEKVMNNGYRYYSVYQLEAFNVISTLKDIGVPLKEIKEFMDKRNPKNIVELFEYETKEIEKEINKLKRKQEIIYNKIKIINEAKNKKDDIFIEEQNEEYLVISKSIDNSKYPYDMKTYMSHLDYCYSNDLNIGYPVGSIKSKEYLEKENYYDYTYYYTKVNKICNCENLVIKPKGTYLVGYFKGYYDKAPILYEKLLKYVKENNLIIVGSSYEDVLIDEVAVKNTDDYVLKVSIQINNVNNKI